VLAQIAMNAARDAGADFADVRIGVQRRIRQFTGPGGPSVGMWSSYGIRAWHGTTWSFQHGSVLTPDAVTAVARGAAAGARRYADINTRLATRRSTHRADSLPSFGETPWAPTSVVTGEWSVPVEIDPFSVPLDDYQRVLGSLVDAAVPSSVYRNASAFGFWLGWQAETRVFASTTGSLVTQHTLCGGAGVRAVAGAHPDPDIVKLSVPDLEQVCAGFEVALRPEIPVQLQSLYNAAVRYRQLPFRPIRDIGRGTVVLDGETMARVVGSTVGSALDGDRVSGIEADGAGGGFLSPPLDILRASAPQFSPQLTMTATRAFPSPMTVHWDDDGVVPESYTVIDGGRVVDFHTTRETAPMLAEWNTQHGRPVRSHGCAVAPTPESVPRCSGGHMMVASAATHVSLEDLVRTMNRGWVVMNGVTIPTPGLTGVDIFNGPESVVLEIQRGVPVARTRLRLQVVVPLLLGKNLIAIGDSTTLGTSAIEVNKGIPWEPVQQFVTAPAALCKDVDLLP